jgi:predicted membrane protein
MTLYKEFNFGGKNNPMGNFGPLIGLVLFLLLMYYFVTGLFTLLNWAFPVLLIGALLLDYTVVTDYGKFIFKLLKENILFGLIAILFTIIGYPAVAGYLFFKAWARRSLKKVVGKMESERNKYDEYEEIKPIKEEDDFIILPKIEKPQEVKRTNGDQKTGNGYEDLFK